jgi:hypothetical protein
MVSGAIADRILYGEPGALPASSAAHALPLLREITELLSMRPWGFQLGDLTSYAELNALRVRVVLDSYVERGQLRRAYAVACPECGASTSPVAVREQVRFGEMLSCACPEPPEIGREMLREIFLSADFDFGA